MTYETGLSVRQRFDAMEDAAISIAAGVMAYRQLADDHNAAPDILEVVAAEVWRLHDQYMQAAGA